jgi:two-component system response regulator HydG
VGEIPLATQVKLLRFLQERTFMRVGGSETMHVDARFVCATNRDLTAAVTKGAFRADLFYRLNVFPIRLPPLRERAGDVGLLVRHFLRRAGRSDDSISEETVARLDGYGWPGNVRELENAMERAVIMAGPERITDEHLPPEIAGRLGHAARHDGEATLDERESRAIEEALAKAGGNKSLAAKFLGITRRRLYSRIASLGRKLGRPPA